MQRILFLCIALCGIVFGIISMNNVSWIQNDTRKTIIVSIIYDGNVETVELEPYTTVFEVLQSRTFENIDLSKLNPERILAHRDVLTIPLVQVKSSVSINTGSKEELMTLKGVGDSLAQKIIDDRNTNGLFQTLEDLMRVKGMGSKKFESLKDFICL